MVTEENMNWDISKERKDNPKKKKVFFLGPKFFVGPRHSAEFAYWIIRPVLHTKGNP